MYTNAHVIILTSISVELLGFSSRTKKINAKDIDELIESITSRMYRVLDEKGYKILNDVSVAAPTNEKSLSHIDSYGKPSE